MRKVKEEQDKKKGFDKTLHWQFSSYQNLMKE